jgi:hypothetical protein
VDDPIIIRVGYQSLITKEKQEKNNHFRLKLLKNLIIEQ